MAKDNSLTKKIVEARETYIHSELTLSEISEQFGINLNTLYTRSSKEGWALLRHNKIKEIISDRNILLNDRKLKSLEFYDKVLTRCYNFINSGMKLDAKELKEIIATHIMAEDRYFLISKHALIEKENGDNSNKSNGILDDLANV